MEPVTAVLLARDHDPDGLSPMVACSVLLHAAVVALVILGPSVLRNGRAVPKVVMSVSLSGQAGPDTGGANPLGGRPVQEAVARAPARPEPVQAPAAKSPDMTLPLPAPKVKPKPGHETPPPKVREAPEGAHGRVPITGPQEKFGSSFAETGVNGLGLGLSTGGGAAGSDLDVNNFCCPDYLTVMARRIRENWNYRQGLAGTTVMRFTIQRDGRITDIGVEQSAGYVLDLTAQRALQMLRQLPPLPAAYTYPTLTVYLKFDYLR
jgi:TonB family protein